MIVVRPHAWRDLFALLLTLVIAVTGVGRALAAAPPPVAIVPGLAMPICHGGDSGEPAQAPQGGHDCCEDCVLATPAMLPGAPELGRPARFADRIEPVVAAGGPPVLSRPRTPRLAQGPPVA